MIFKQYFIIFLFVINFSGFASEIQSKSVTPQVRGVFSKGIGSIVSLKTIGKTELGESIFLGNVLKADGENSYRIYLNKANNKIYYIDSNNFSKSDSQLQTILDPNQQAGGTCTGYAIDNFLIQTHFTGFVGNGELASELSTEDGRSYLLVDAINQYYMTPQHRNSISGILNGYGKKFGFHCSKFVTDDFHDAKKYIIKTLSLGSPVLFSFNIGPNMANSPFELKYFDSKKPEIDTRLWIPRKTGERNSGGHSIVAAGYFEYNQKLFLVMIDSDWSEPRVWDLEAFVNEKTAINEMEFISCKE